jgi:hypothetical protein
MSFTPFQAVPELDQGAVVRSSVGVSRVTVTDIILPSVCSFGALALRLRLRGTS